METLTPPTLAVEAQGLVKSFGATRAVDGIDLQVPVGCVYGVLGPNGAGKTTTIRMLATLLVPDGGRASVFGHDIVRRPRAVRTRIALTGQFASVDQELTGAENLVLLARLLGFGRRAARARAEELLTAFGLEEAGRDQVRTYSGGMRRRIDIAASLVVSPRLLCLDEPTTGLDPRSRNQVWDVVRSLVDEGTTVLLTTQYLEEADQLADRIAVIDRGRVIAEGPPAELKASVGSGVLHVRLDDPARRAEARALLSQQLGAEVVAEAEPGVVSATVARRTGEPAAGRVADALAVLARAGVAIADVSFGPPSLDEVFLALTGHRAEGDDARVRS